MPLIGVFKSLSCLYSRNACEIARTRASSRSVTCVPTTTTPTTLRSPPRVAQTQLGLVDLPRRQVAQDGILDVHQLLALGAEHRDRAQPQPILLLDQVGGQR